MPEANPLHAVQSIVVFKAKAIMKPQGDRLQDGAYALNIAMVSEKMSVWSAAHVASIANSMPPAIPIVTATDATRALPDFDLWDLWPVQTVDGRVADFDGWSVWMILSAPILPDPDSRHDVARIRLVTERRGEWRDCGNLYPDGHCPGSREWAGSSLFDPATATLTSFHTAAGRRGQAATFEQRIFQSSATLTVVNGVADTQGWTTPTECFQSDNDLYVRADHAAGVPGHIKGFRDPAHFRDPADGADYLLFTGSLGHSQSAWNGVVGIAKSTSGNHDDWALLPPLISADALNNELERPHVIAHDGLYYLFWSTQAKVFAPDGPTGPTGLYGMVAPALFGPYAPLNGSGLVAPNPTEEPFQTYSWWVTDDLEVAGFVDHWGLAGRSLADHPELRRAHFGGTPAPRFKLALEGDRATVV
jgi:levansucrase